MESNREESNEKICESCVRYSKDTCNYVKSVEVTPDTEICIIDDHFEPREGTILHTGKTILSECEKLWIYVERYPNLLDDFITDYYKIKDYASFLDHLGNMKDLIQVIEDLIKNYQLSKN